MASYYKFGILGVDEAIATDTEGYISIADLNHGEPSTWLVVEVRGGEVDNPNISEPEERIGGLLKQIKARRKTMSVPVRALKFPAEMTFKRQIEDVFGHSAIFIAPIQYPDPDAIAENGKALRIVGGVGVEHNYENGTKVITLKIKAFKSNG